MRRGLMLWSEGVESSCMIVKCISEALSGIYIGRKSLRGEEDVSVRKYAPSAWGGRHSLRVM